MVTAPLVGVLNPRKMLEIAYKHKEALQEAWLDWILTKDSMFYDVGIYSNFKLGIEETNWSRNQFVSVNSSGDIIGWFTAYYNVEHEKYNEIGVALFEKNIVSMRDMYTFFKTLYNDPKARKIEWYVVVGNEPAEKLYFNIINRFDGSITGLRLKSVRLRNGKYYDTRHFEVFKKA